MGAILDLLKDVPLSAVLRENISTLESENETLKQKLAESEEKRRTLEKKIEQQEQHPADLILSFLCHNPDASEADIASGVGVAVASVKHWLNHFRSQGNMIDKNGQVTGDAIFYLSTRGLA